MKLATLRDGGRDGTLVVVDRSLNRAMPVPQIVDTLQRAIESWDRVAPQLEAVYENLNEDEREGFQLDSRELASPLPRTYQWLDGSAYLSHVERVRKARGAELPERLLTDPLMYQGGGDTLLGPRDPICLLNEDWGLDFESEVGVITDDVPMGVTPTEAAGHIKLMVLINDLSLRNLIPSELAKGFGFLQGKPSSSLSPVAVTPNELNTEWIDNKVHLPLRTWLNGECFGEPDAGEGMQFDFAELISHAAKTRRLSAGTLVGSGTVSNEDTGRGCSCLVEKRVLEIIESGEAKTPFLSVGDRVHIEMLDREGHSIFGAIEQEVIACLD
ncbi:MAG: fumarylacetoacetate hydrolase family protein [Candidatus Thiodiazotropha sp. (ex Monitilora ramsayi)]|nr:fumarylacetoacetate hydrolase family protein [Candidatus Thiodiazotropha sp. (ex Monitilora ramsayi)]